MLYYVGIEPEFIKAQCREYKTLDGALKAAAKNEDFTVWDENGNKVEMVAEEDVPEGALETNPDDNVNAYNEVGKLVGTADEETVAEVVGEVAEIEDEEAEKDPLADVEIISGGVAKAMVICEGTLNLRRFASWAPESICGRASKGQTYYVKAIHTVDDKMMVETIDGLYLSGLSEHVHLVPV